MSRRLVKIAKELNVGTSTIVEFLQNNGFEIDNKPTSKVSDDMYEALLEEFSNSIAVKEEADKLIIGNRVQKEDEPISAEPVPEAKAEEPKQKEVPKEEKKEEEVVIKAEVPKAELKVVGKVDLEDQKQKKKKEESKEEKKEEPAPEAEQKTDENKEEPAPEAESTPDEEVLRAETPQLQGLKIQGKIDINKFEKPKKKEVESKADSKEGQTKRKRTRKKVTAQSLMKRQQNKDKSKGKKEEEPKTISQKEIEEKIKATMARISGGGKSKRQKVRRDSRADKREKQEMMEEQMEETTLKLTEFISASELAGLLDVGVSEVITKCMNLGVIVSINQRMDAEIIELVANEFGCEVEFISAEDQEDTVLEDEQDDPEDLKPRAPIVTVMGHVDHGKTSLLDYIRNANVVAGEAGGITQHVGAYSVNVGDNKVTFLDTPGHEAFTAMRARGAKVTDIVVVIIAADDKIMPQTKEAISHAQAAGVPIVFAINKVDKEGADANRIKQELSEMNILVEEWGGKYQSQDISAKTGLNIDQLLEKLLLEAEMLELKANPDKFAIGTVVEASLDKGRGYVTKLLVQAGTLS
ncbi:MAG: GTP-binding protein, partial [Chitinophagia bacterium]|nr:GTP-binding protein [Chitinophagia bacterium]